MTCEVKKTLHELHICKAVRKNWSYTLIVLFKNLAWFMQFNLGSIWKIFFF